MPEVKWIKITTDMFDDEKIKLLEAMPDADTLLVIWIKLVCQAGKVNTDGYIFLAENVPYTEEQIATVFNRPVNTVKLALRAFHQLKMIEINEDGFIFLPNFSKHQNMEGLAKVREKTRLRVAKYRLLKTGEIGNKNVTGSNVTVTQQNKNKNKNKNKNRKEENKNIILLNNDNHNSLSIPDQIKQIEKELENTNLLTWQRKQLTKELLELKKQDPDRFIKGKYSSVVLR